MADDIEEQDFKILEALAKIQDLQDFRLSALMRQLGMDERQPVLFYRALIKEAREFMSLVDLLEQSIDHDTKAIAKQRQQINTLNAKLSNLETGSQNKIESLEKEKHQSEATISGLKDKAESYDGLKDLVSGKKSTETLVALHHFIEDMYTDRLNERLGMRPPPDLAQLDSIGHKLRADLLEILKIPRDTLEKENIELKKLNEALKNAISIVYGGRVE